MAAILLVSFFVECWVFNCTLFLSAFFFLKNLIQILSKISCITVPKSLDPDQARHYVWPDLGPDFLLRLSAPSLKKIHSSGKGIKNVLRKRKTKPLKN